MMVIKIKKNMQIIFSDSISFVQEDIISKLEKIEINYINEKDKKNENNDTKRNIDYKFNVYPRKRKSNSLSSEKKEKILNPKR